MSGLDALQVVALEERIITDERTYPSGEAFWAAVDALRERGAHIPEYEPDPGDGDPVSALPLGRLNAVESDQQRRMARSRGLDWPDTDDAREQLRTRLLDAVRHREEVVIDAPTGLGKTYAVTTEPWLWRTDVTASSLWSTCRRPARRATRRWHTAGRPTASGRRCCAAGRKPVPSLAGPTTRRPSRMTTTWSR